MIHNNKILIFLRKIMKLKGILSRLKANDESLKKIELTHIFHGFNISLTTKPCFTGL